MKNRIIPLITIFASLMIVALLMNQAQARDHEAIAPSPFMSASSAKSGFEFDDLNPESDFLEFQGRMFGTYSFSGDEAYGGGLGLNVFFTEDLGIGIDYAAFDYPSGDIVHDATASVIYRITSTDFEPYGFLGGGMRAATAVRASVHAGIGVNYWLSETLALFVEGRYTWYDGKEGELPLEADPSVRVGAVISF